ncbi:hypothetical protein [Streptomyces violascens]
MLEVSPYGYYRYLATAQARAERQVEEQRPRARSAPSTPNSAPAGA